MVHSLVVDTDEWVGPAWIVDVPVNMIFYYDFRIIGFHSVVAHLPRNVTKSDTSPRELHFMRPHTLE